MIGLEISDIKGFMAEWLIRDMFDKFLISEVELITSNKYTVSGKINSEWYSSEELEQLLDLEYMQWSKVKPYIYSIIKGSKTPSYIKSVMMLPQQLINEIITTNNLHYRIEDIGGLYINLRFENGELALITGISFNTFVMDKTLEHIWDDYIKNFLLNRKLFFTC